MAKGHLYAPLGWVKKKLSELWNANDELNSKLEWKLLGEVTGKQIPITLPNDFNELFIDIYHSSRHFQFHVVRTELGNDLKAYLSGFYYNANTNGSASAQVSLTMAQIASYYVNGAENNSATMVVYYR